MKITLIKHNVAKYDETIKKGLEQVTSLLNSINFPIYFDVHEDNKPLHSVPFLSETGTKGYMVNPQDIVSYDVQYNADTVCLIYDANDISPAGTNPTENGEYIQIPAQWFNQEPDIFVLYFLHELAHEMFWKYSKPDVTHNFYTSPFAQMPGGMTKYYLSLLKQFTDDKPIITLKRVYKPWGTYGELSVGAFKCKTLELPWLNNRPSMSCIPEGKYKIKKVFWYTKGKYVYEIQKVTDRLGIFFHSANYTSQLKGCIALGKNFVDLNGDKIDDLGTSAVTVKAFMDYLGGKEATLIITS